MFFGTKKWLPPRHHWGIGRHHHRHHSDLPHTPTEAHHLNTEQLSFIDSFNRSIPLTQRGNERERKRKADLRKAWPHVSLFTTEEDIALTTNMAIRMLVKKTHHNAVRTSHTRQKPTRSSVGTQRTRPSLSCRIQAAGFRL